jgi:hypothetical protein
MSECLPKRQAKYVSKPLLRIHKSVLDAQVSGGGGDSEVSIATRYILEDPGVSNPGVATDLSSPGVQPASCT